MKNDSTIEFIKKHKGYDDKQSLKAAYQVGLFKRAILYNMIILAIMSLLGLFKECMVLFVMFKLFRENTGGIHLVGHIKCLMYSTAVIVVAILLAKFIDMSIHLEIVVYTYIILTWWLFVPQGTSQRPIRKEKEKQKMKRTTLILILMTIALRFMSIHIYELAIWSLSLTLLFTTPIAYKIFKVKHDRMVDATDVVDIDLHKEVTR